MCGLAGLWSKAPSQAGAQKASAFLQGMAQAMHSRGPDSEGTYSSACVQFNVVHKRLAILDLSEAGHQPMRSACGRWVLAFNGEIYNHLELRKQLDAQSNVGAHEWRGHSDTETLLVAFQHWGFEATLKVTVGMFAIALWDEQEQRLFLARDRFGEKPLYVGFVQSSQAAVNRSFAFASDLKSISGLPGFKNSIDARALADYFQYLYVPAPQSIFEGLGKLRPGHWMVLNRQHIQNGVLPASQPYWQYSECIESAQRQPFESESEAISTLERVLEQAISDQCLADVPLGAFLSGGVDSSAIVALMQKHSSRPVNTFTVGFDVAGYDESAHAKAVAQHLGTEHHELRVSSDDALAVVGQLPQMYSEPFADSSQIPTHLVCRSARAHSTVALSGDAGDELFGGYNRYFWGPKVWRKAGPMGRLGRNALAGLISAGSPAAWDRLTSVVGRGRGQGADGVVRVGEKLHKLASRLKDTGSIDEFYTSLVSEWRTPSDLLTASAHGGQADRVAGGRDGLTAFTPVERMMVTDALAYLPDDILVKVDRAAMAISLETRAPFLDHRVAEVAWRLPMHMKIRDGVGKWALRQVLYKQVPQSLIERPKAGFAIPLMDWLKGPLRDWAETLLAPAALNDHGLLRGEVVQSVWQEHLSGRYDHTAKLWAVLMFQSWYQAHCAGSITHTPGEQLSA